MAKDDPTLKQAVIGGVYALLQAAGLILVTVVATELLQKFIG